MKNMKLAIVGSRTFNDYEFLKQTVNSLSNIKSITHIVSGGANGADTLAEKYCLENELELIIFLPDWKKYGRSAGMIRNKDIINTCDIVIAFWDGKSRGTENSIKLARTKHNKKECYVINYEDGYQNKINKMVEEF